MRIATAFNLAMTGRERADEGIGPYDMAITDRRYGKEWRE